MRTVSTIKKLFVIDVMRIAQAELFLHSSHILLTFLWTWQHQRNVDNWKCLVMSEFLRFTSALVWSCGYKCEQWVLDVLHNQTWTVGSCHFCGAFPLLLVWATIYYQNKSCFLKRNIRNIDGLLARWLSKLEKYDFTIVHKKGSQHGNADGLSCILPKKCPPSECPQYS